MKKLLSYSDMQRPCAARGSHQRDRRKGAFFNYILVYMTIASALMTTAGMCLHSILRADLSERRESQFLSSLSRTEHQLRADTTGRLVTFESATSILVTAVEPTKIRWSSDRGILTREEVNGEQTVGSDRFVFTAGTLIQMVQSAEDVVLVRITEPSPFVTYSQVSNGGSNRNKPAEVSTPATPSHVAQPKTVEIRLKGAKQ